MSDKDTIYRQDAIDIICKTAFSSRLLYGRSERGMQAKKEAITALKSLPSAEPEKVLVAEVKLSKDQIQSAVDEAVEKMRTELDPFDFCKHKDDCGYMFGYCPAERKEE